MTRPTGWIGLFCAWMFLTASAVLRTANQDRPAEPEWLVENGFQRYRAGQHDAVPKQLVSAMSFDSILEGVFRLAKASPSELQQFGKRMALATFTLELAYARPTYDPDLNQFVSDDERRRQVEMRVRMVSLGGRILTGGGFTERQAADVNLARTPLPAAPVDPRERLWFEAAFAALRSYWSEGLISLPPGFSRIQVYPMVELAAARFPNEPWVMLAAAAAREHFGWAVTNGGIGRPLIPARMPGTVDVAVRFSNQRNPVFAEQERLLRTALETYEKLVASQEFRTVASLRAGFVRLLIRDYGQARKHFATVISRGSALDAFLGNLLTGWTWENSGNLRAAEANYRAALGLVPDARSASVLLGSLLMRRGDLEGARQYLPLILSEPGSGTDPWTSFYVEIGASWSTLMARLRAALVAG